ncbi:MAG: LuxR C-terminal-related transcriptional regulator [Pseudomonadota bacterium]
MSQRGDICAALADFGFSAVAYLGPLNGENGQAPQLTSVGFSNEWEQAYRSHWHQHDPLPRIAQAGHPIFWMGHGLPEHPLSSDERAYLAQLSQWGMRDCVGALCVGPNMRTAFVLVGGRDPSKMLEQPDLGALQAIIQVSFLRYCALLEEELTQPALTDREYEILRLLAQGEAQENIAPITGLSEGSVRTYCYGLFRKLGAKDPASAVLRGVSYGLVSIPPRVPTSVAARHAEALKDAGWR